MKSQYRVVVIGGGVVGSSVLYHLAKMGWKDVVMLERRRLASGSSWHAAGGVHTLNADPNMAALQAYTIDLLPKIEKESGQNIGFHMTGGLTLAGTPERWEWLQSNYRIFQSIGISDCELLSPEEAQKRCPIMSVDGVLGAMWADREGYIDTTGTVQAYASAARKKGAEYYEEVKVDSLEQLTDGWIVKTDKGNIKCEHVVNAAGSFCPEVAQMVGLKNVPSINMIHQYLVTEAHPEIEKLSKELPVIRDPDSSSYLRQEGKGLLIGPYEKDVAAWALDGMDWKFDMELLDPDLDRIAEHLEKGMDRIPQFKDVGIKRIICGPITHTPDDNFLAGPAPGLKNFWMFCAASIGIAHGGGAGKYMAQWIVHGDSEINMMEFEPRRYMSWVDKNYSVEKSKEQYRRMYVTPMPNDVVEVGRPMKTTPIYQKLKEKGAEYFDLYGWEKPAWFNKDNIKEELSYKRNNLFPIIQKECLHVHNNVGLIDLSTFSKYEITGEDSYNFLERLCVNRVPKKDGSIVLTHLLNDIGRIQTELTLTKLKDNHYYALSGAVSEIRDLDWLNQNKKENEKVEIKNITLDKGVIGIIGPKSRMVLQKLTDTDLGNENFPWLKSKEVSLDDITVTALRVNYMGELGWELHHDFKDMEKLYELLSEAGKEFDIIDFGAHAMNSMRIEKGYRGWGSELTPEISVVEAGLERFFNIEKKSEFKGSKIVSNLIKNGPKIKLVYMEVDAVDADAHGNEPIYSNGNIVGLTTSGAYGYRVNKSLAFGYVETKFAKVGNEFLIKIQGKDVKSKVIDEPAFDSNNDRLKS